MRDIKKHIAFTLAEVLIVVGIIGIIAEMVIPTLIIDVQNKTNMAAWKKEFSTMSQIWRQVISENGGSISSSSTAASDISNDYGAQVLAKLKYTRKCTAPTNIGDNTLCWHDASKYYTLNKHALSDVHADAFKMILNDGSLWLVNSLTNSCPSNDVQCLYFAVDVNGFKGPNMQGKDIFFGAAFGGGKVIAHGTSPDTNPTDPAKGYDCITSSPSTSDNQGQGCSYLALYCNDIDYTTGTCKN